MQITPEIDQALHKRLPIDEEEKVLAVFKHHWFAYISPILITALLVLAVLGSATLLLIGGNDIIGSQYHPAIMVGTVLILIVVVLAGLVPVYLTSQEMLVLTDEALIQVLQPSLLASKIEQLGLNDLANISVHNDFIGSLLGFSHLGIETPGEQDNYEFKMVKDAAGAARMIVSSHENYEAALEGGRLKSTLGEPPQQIDPMQYQEFLKYQAMVEQQKQQAAGTGQPSGPDGNTPQ
jgi:hypothetical protein